LQNLPKPTDSKIFETVTTLHNTHRNKSSYNAQILLHNRTSRPIRKETPDGTCVLMLTQATDHCSSAIQL